EIAENADDHFAVAGLQGVAHEAAPMRPPGVLDFLAEVARHEVGDGILETLSLLVGVGEVVGVGADAKSSLAVGRWPLAEASDDQSHEQRQRAACSSANGQR